LGNRGDTLLFVFSAFVDTLRGGGGKDWCVWKGVGSDGRNICDYIVFFLSPNPYAMKRRPSDVIALVLLPLHFWACTVLVYDWFQEEEMWYDWWAVPFQGMIFDDSILMWFKNAVMMTDSIRLGRWTKCYCCPSFERSGIFWLRCLYISSDSTALVLGSDWFESSSLYHKSCTLVSVKVFLNSCLVIFAENP